jgi:hypothetical protein
MEGIAIERSHLLGTVIAWELLVDGIAALAKNICAHAVARAQLGERQGVKDDLRGGHCRGQGISLVDAVQPRNVPAPLSTLSAIEQSGVHDQVDFDAVQHEARINCRPDLHNRSLAVDVDDRRSQPVSRKVTAFCHFFGSVDEIGRGALKPCDANLAIELLAVAHLAPPSPVAPLPFVEHQLSVGDHVGRNIWTR